MPAAALVKTAKPQPDWWAERCRYWLELAFDGTQRPVKRITVRDHKPLVLTGHGMRLRVHHGALVVRDGFTHHPQKVEEQRFFPGARDLPSRIVILDGSGSLSIDVLSWLSEQEIPLIKLDWKGSVVSVVGANCAVDQHVVACEQQRAIENRVECATQLIQQKLRACIETLELMLPPSASRAAAVERLTGDVKLLKDRKPKDIRNLLGIEGRAAFAYFSAWQGLPLKWSGARRLPIPSDWHSAGPRQSRVGEKTGSRNSRASHPVNAMLNYSYAVLANQVRIRILSEGYDPKLGFLHAPGPRRDAFVLDLMEPLRPVVDRSVLQLVRENTFRPADFNIRADGVCRLNPELARYISSRTGTLLERGTSALGNKKRVLQHCIQFEY